MRRLFKRAFLRVSKALGLFALARRLSRHGLRILGYHGGSFRDEHVFRPGLFISPEVFQERLRVLARGRYPVLSLNAALDALTKNALPPCATVITIDDAFCSTFRQALGPLKEHSFPATLYVTTYYAAKETPVFRLVLQYLFWKTQVRELDCTDLDLGATGVHPLETEAQKEQLWLRMLHHAETKLTEPERCTQTRELGRRLQVDYDALVASRSFHLMTAEEIRTAAAEGIDIQLHTHRHCCPLEQELVKREVKDNREFLQGLAAGPLVHFCYPSGLWRPEHLGWLEADGVSSATTCDTGLNHPDTPRLALKRFLDADNRSAIEFEAEVCGFAEMLRGGRARLRRLLGR